MGSDVTVEVNRPREIPREISGYEKPLFSLLDEAARLYPDQTCTLFKGSRQSYREVKRCTEQVVAFLRSQGIRKGDRVAVFLPNLPHFPAIFFGIIKAGAICVTCNPLYTASELGYQLKDSGARAVFCMDHSEFYPVAVKAIQGTEVRTVVVCNIRSSLPKIKGLLGSLLGKIPKARAHEPGHFFFDQAVGLMSPDTSPADIDPAGDPALIIYTGGTTGTPKGAVLTHSNLVFHVQAVDEWARLPHDSRSEPEKLRPGGYHCYLGVLPWYHIFGLSVCMLSACASGSRLVCIPDPRAGKPPFSDVLKAVEHSRPTLLVAVPTIFSAFVNHPRLDRYDLSSIMLCVSGGAPLPRELCKRFEDKTGSLIIEGYGLSETSPVVTVNPTNRQQRRLGSVGYALPNTVIKIVDQKTGQTELEQGEDGEIAVHGPQVMPGYWNRPEADAESFREIEGQRFFLTGDIGHKDPDGYVVITDRKKDVILVSGFNCYPREVEEVLYQHPKVALAAVVGVPSEKSGQEVKAFVQPVKGEKCTEQELLEFCKERLAGYKRPRSIEFRDELPVSAVGKVLRRMLRDEEVKGHG
ncbi:MAG: long-chain fatty acid--CoA ligase [Desulfohalobiaceae bacterium]|nr:long-chain fatty acid--CoA ligase [Desulfohalobiaceae bacterium]